MGRRRIPLMLSDSDWEGWARDRQQEQLMEELYAIGLVCDDPRCPAVHVDLSDVSSVAFIEEPPPT